MATITGTDDNDSLRGTAEDDTIFGGDGIDIIDGRDGDDFLDGGIGNDNIRGSNGDDTVFGGLGDDTILLGNGDDFVVHGGGFDLIYGGDGRDTLDLSELEGSVWVRNGGAIGESDTTNNVRLLSEQGFIIENLGEFVDIEVIIGTEGRDFIRGNALDNRLVGNGGVDLLIGLEGADTLDGTGGVTTANYAESNAGITINLITGEASGGHAEGDVLIDIEALVGSDFDDFLAGRNDGTIVLGGRGSDTLFGGDGDDRIRAGDETGVESSNNLIDAGAGDDSIRASFLGGDTISGGEGDDTLDYSFSAGVDVDLIAGTVDKGVSDFNTDRGDDVVSGIENILADGLYDSTLRGSDDDNTLVTGSGNDFIDGRGGDDLLTSGNGDDTIIGGAGDDTIDTGIGVSVIRFEDGHGNDIVRALLPHDTLDFSGLSGGVLTDLDSLIAASEDTTLDDQSGVLITTGDDSSIFIVGASVDGLTNMNFVFEGGEEYVSPTLGIVTSGDGGNGDDFITAFGNFGEFIEGGDGNDVLVNSGQGFSGIVILGEGGDDLLIGRNGSMSRFDDSLSGGDGNDTLFGRNGIDFLNGGNGDDYIDGGDEVDQVRGDQGNDTIVGGLRDIVSYESSPVALLIDASLTSMADGFGTTDTLVDVNNFRGTNFDDTLEGDDRFNRLQGANGDDIINGGGCGDSLNGGSGDDTLDGGTGDDSYFGGEGADVFVMSEGTDTIQDFTDGEDIIVVTEAGVSFESLTIVESFGDVSITTPGGQIINLDNTSLSEIDASDFIGLGENIVGTNAAESLAGGDNDDTLNGGRGDDTLNGGAGDDVLFGGTQSDRLDGGAGNDNLLGGNGNDTVEGGSGSDTLSGSIGDDRLNGGSQGDRLFGDAGADTLNGGGGADRVDYLRGDTAILVDLETGEATGGDAEGDTLISIESVFGSTGNDTLRALQAGSRLNGAGGDDVVIGRGGDDRLAGGNGNDLVSGGAGDDLIGGNRGDDTLIGGAGADTLSGGPGADLVDYSESDAQIVVDLAEGTVSGGHAEGDLILAIWHVTGSAFDDELTGDRLANRIDGGSGRDTVVGGAGADTLTGGRGIDWLDYSSSASAVTVDLENGSGEGGDAEGDVVSGFENLVGSDFDDLLIGNQDPNNLLGGDGDDTLVGGSGADTLQGGSGNNWSDYSASSTSVRVNLETGTGEFGDATGDRLIDIQNVRGSEFSDTLTGSDADNAFNSGAGDDTITGGGGSDTFIFEGAHGADVIRDFDPETDTLSLVNTITDFTDFASVQAAMSSGMSGDQTGVFISTGGGNDVFLEGVTLSDLTSESFIL